MTRIYIVRHCEAEGNIYRRAQGQYDGRVTPKGRAQIAALAERFRDIPLDAVYSSDLRRARETAGAILKYHSLPLLTDIRLREWGIGSWEDVPFGNLEKQSPEQLDRFNNDPARFQAEGAEPWEALRSRIGQALRSIARRHPEGSAAVVSHGMAIRTLLAGIEGIPSAEIRRVGHGDNTSVSLVEAEDGRFRVVFANDVSHLSAALSTFARQSWWREKTLTDRNNVSFQPLDPVRYPSRYLEFYQKTWAAAHGSLAGFHASLYRDDAIRHVRVSPEALVTIVRPDGEAVGIIELDLERCAEQGVGWICLCYVEESCRRQLLGVQLIGHAVSVFRRRGFHAAQLCVYDKNLPALRFYEANEFYPVGETSGAGGGRLLILEKAL